MNVTLLDGLRLFALPFLLILGLAVVSCDSSSTAKDVQSETAPELSSQEVQSLLPLLAEAVGKKDEAFHFVQTSEGNIKVKNPSVKVSAVFTPDSVTVTNKSGASVTMKVSGAEVTNPVRVSADRVEYRRGNITEWYKNNPLGLEQGFTVNSRPEGLDGKLSMKLDFELSEGLVASQSETTKSVKFTDEAKGRVMKYGKLHAYDSTGKALPSEMLLADNSIILSVDDTNATYPVVIDPTFEDQIISAGTPEDRANFGTCVDLAEDYAIVGEPDRTVCTVNGSSVDETGTVSETEEGETVEITEEGETINTIDEVICIPGAGAAYIFERMGPANWQQVAMYENPTPFFNDHFGASCDIYVGASIGNAIVGIPDDNICINGNLRFDGGTACIFEEGGDWSTATCQKIGASDCNTGDEFGFSVGIDMTTAIVGAPEDQTRLRFPRF